MFQLEVPYLLQPKWRSCVVYIDLLQVGALAAMFPYILHLVMDFVSIAAINLILKIIHVLTLRVVYILMESVHLPNDL